MRAILLCAGMGTRLHPFTINTHKSLLPIKGKPLIEHTLEYLHRKNITDITIVIGHCKEQFAYLKDKFGVELRVSKVYETHNNYTSMQLVLDKLEDTVVLEGDFLIIDDFIERIDTSKNQYFGQEIIHGVEWGIKFDENYRIQSLILGATEGVGLIGISYWKGDMTKALSDELGECGIDEYWDDAVCRLLDKFEVYVNPVEHGVALECDSVSDILFHKLMSYKEIAQWVSESDIEIVNENSFYIVQKQQRYLLSFRDNEATLEVI